MKSERRCQTKCERERDYDIKRKRESQGGRESKGESKCERNSKRDHEREKESNG